MTSKVSSYFQKKPLTAAVTQPNEFQPTSPSISETIISNFRSKAKESCTICLEELSLDAIRGRLTCSHTEFCLACVLAWLDVTSSCPLCKQPTISVDHIDGKDGPTLKRTPISPKSPVSHEEDSEYHQALVALQAACLVCQGSDDEAHFILCESCNDGCHTYCVGLTDVPEDDWYCATCEQQRQGIPRRQVRSSSVFDGPRSRHGYALDGFVVNDNEEVGGDEDTDYDTEEEEEQDTLDTPSQTPCKPSGQPHDSSPDLILLDNPSTGSSLDAVDWTQFRRRRR
eukprot:m.21314 g.21314  ORF g.21314 m.21314 type:complete len:284 (+) comp11123_c0_seq1:141-992(+)